MSELCCYIDIRQDGAVNCDTEADYQINAVREGGIPAGPDPYSDETFACETHLAVMLGCQPDAERQNEIYWEVRIL